MATEHRPVLCEEVRALAAGARRAVDATVGGGGHADVLRSGGAAVLAIDRDARVLAETRRRLGEGGVTWLEGRFADPGVLQAVAGFRPDFALLDLGVSSWQLDVDARGFSFRRGVALDMRMEGRGQTAAQLLNTASVHELQHIFRRYGDERQATRLARSVARRRQRAPLAVSDDLVGAIREVLGPRAGPPDFARLFQAVRIAVNDELTQLAAALPAFREALVPGGALVVISYHSGEDRLVKHEFRDWARACVCPPAQPVCTCRGVALGSVDPRRPITPSPDEVRQNPRARSARLRGFRKDGDT